MSEKLLDILFKSYRRQVLMLLFQNSEQQYHVREIARLTNTVAGTVNKELLKLSQAGLLKKSNQGNQVLYSADKTCPIYNELVSILTKTTITANSVKRNRDSAKDDIESVQRMLDAISRINDGVDNKIQLSHSPDVQNAVMKHLRELLHAGDLLEEKSAFSLKEIEDIMRNEASPGLESVWKIIKQDLPILEQELLKRTK